MNKIIFYEEWKEFNKQFKNMIGNSEILNEFFKNLRETNIKHIDSVIKNFHEDSIEDEKSNIDIIESEWGEGFALYAYYISSCIDFSDSFIEYLSEVKNITEYASNIETLKVLRFLNGRAIQVANEILVLLRNGYADGAYARFRTLYEISIIANFISLHGDVVAKEYIKYDEHKYHWAAGVIKNKKPKCITFKDIQNNCGLDKSIIEAWEKEYRTSNKLVHASTQGTFSRLSVGGQLNIIPVGPVDSGIVVPATNSLQALFEINRTYFRWLSDPFVYTWIITLEEIKKKSNEKFQELERLNFPKGVEQ